MRKSILSYLVEINDMFSHSSEVLFGITGIQRQVAEWIAMNLKVIANKSLSSSLHTRIYSIVKNLTSGIHLQIHKRLFKSLKTLGVLQKSLVHHFRKWIRKFGHHINSNKCLECMGGWVSQAIFQVAWLRTQNSPSVSLQWRLQHLLL